jgi:hypothetical protein
LLRSRLALPIGLVLLLAGCTPPATLVVLLTSPDADLFTNGSVAVQVTVSGGTPDRVELFLDGTLLTQLPAPYAFGWDTGSIAEGVYQLEARATLGGGVFVSAPRSVTVDRTPPTVTSRSPAPGSGGIYVGDPVVVTLSEPLLATSVTGGVLDLRDGADQPVALELALSPEGTVLTATLLENVDLPATLNATLATSVTDRAGNALVLPAGGWSWLLPTLIAPDGLGSLELDPDKIAQRAELAIDGQDRPVAAWFECAAIGFVDCELVVLRRAEGAWQQLGGVVNSDSALHLDLALDGSDRPVVAYSDYDGGQYRVYVARWQSGNWLHLGGALNIDSLANAFEPGIAVDDQDRPVVAWTEDGDAYAARWDGAAWQPLGAALDVDPAEGARAPDVTTDGMGRPVVSWQESTPTELSSIRVRRWTGSAWVDLGGPLDVVTDQGGARWPGTSLTTDSDGEPAIAWHEQPDGGSFEVYAAGWDGVAWLTLLPSLAGAASGSSPSLALDGDDTVVVAWQEAGASGSDLQLARRDGSVWTSLTDRANVLAGSSPTDHTVALDADGHPHLLWSEIADGEIDIHYKRFNVLP